ncbi:flagellar basal body-associated protein FliL [Alteribacter keqinensis]|uniref:Flagellar protein FliL n=1 Tax=Alteribacter keqinensis TaxID=2483800 RepID=A0A3M7TVC8_9BACI|nr:flagellar basal body-associated protein FliL [Alteribacter keqinensis]RNA69586.1 flagellar basal body-associated protein FliL [Alteribacter keqinensis]
MFKNRLVSIMVIILTTLTLIGAITLVIVTQFVNPTSADSEPTIDEMIQWSVETDEITTNLLSNNVIRTKFVIQLDSKKTKEEFEKRDFQVENIIIRVLSDRSASDFKGSESIVELEEELAGLFNDLLVSGSVESVYLRERIIQ